MQAPRTCVLIPVYGREDVFVTIDFLRKSPYANDLFFVVVDNGNEPELGSRLLELKEGDCHVIQLSENLGGSGAFAAAMQYVIDSGRFMYAWLLDDDALVNMTTYPALIDTYRELTSRGVRLGAIGSAMLGRRNPDIITEVGCGVSRFTGRIKQRYFGRNIAEVGERTEEVDYVAAASLLVKVETMKEVGVFAPVFIHCDDIDWCLRMREHGYRIYATTKSIINHMEWESKFADWLHYYDTRNVLWLMSRHFPLTGFFAHIKLFAQLVLNRLHGRVSVASLMWLGFCHAKSSTVLLRKDLPPSRIVEYSLGELDVERRDLVVVVAGKTRINSWNHILRYRRNVATLIYDKSSIGSICLSVMRYLGVSLRLLLHRNVLVICDVCCIKNNPLVILRGERMFFYIRDETPIVFAEL